MKKKSEPHVGPNKKVISLYVDKPLHGDMKKRAKALNMSLSKYVLYLAQRDMNGGGNLTVEPQPSASHAE